MVDKDLIEILACPENKTPVSLAGAELVEKINAAIGQGQVKTRGGQIVKKKIDGGLVRKDGAFLYPIEDDIPIMLIDEAIPLEGFGA